MKVSVTGKQLDVSAALRGRIEARLAAAVEKYFGNAIEAHVTVSRQGNRFRTDCSVHVGHGIFIQGHGEESDAYASFDGATERVEKQLRRYKRRLRNHHAKQRENEARNVRALSYVLANEADDDDQAEEDDAGPVIVAESTTDIPTCTVGEAVMRMDLGSLPVVMFHNSAHGRINVVYRRTDGHIGWIDPAEAQS